MLFSRLLRLRSFREKLFLRIFCSAELHQMVTDYVKPVLFFPLLVVRQKKIYSINSLLLRLFLFVIDWCVR